MIVTVGQISTAGGRVRATLTAAPIGQETVEFSSAAAFNRRVDQAIADAEFYALALGALARELGLTPGQLANKTWTISMVQA